MMSHEIPHLKNEAKCTGCGACIASCPHGAITKKSVGFGAWIPKIDTEKCLRCGICASVCNRELPRQAEPKKAYIAYNRNADIRLKSASGGVFSALASYVLDHGGSVYGAEMRFEKGKAIVEHVKITCFEDLPRILGSKYVQSDCFTSYKLVKEDLLANKTVLFSGCSCQITGLKQYLGKVDQTNLYTIDLICHGVPGIDLFNDYIEFLQKKYNGTITRFSFRTKEKDRIIYKISADLNGNNWKVGGDKCPISD